MTTHFPTIAIRAAKEQASMSIDATLIPLHTAMANINVILNKRDLRESMTDDQVIDIGLVAKRLEAIENMLLTCKEMIAHNVYSKEELQQSLGQ